MKIAKAAIISIALLLGLGIVGVVFAENPHNAGTNPDPTGQPSQTCGDCATAPTGPGNAPNAPGSAFNEPSLTNPDGGVAGQVYAGNNPNAPGFVNGNANLDKAVSQYDVACFQVSQQSQGKKTPEIDPNTGLPCPDC